MKTQIAPSNRSLLGRMTAAERMAGRFLRDGEGHPPATPAPAPQTAVPVTPPDASLIPAEPVAPAAPAAPVRPDGLADAFWDDASGVKPEAYARLAELEAAEAARRDGLPATAADYSLALGEEVLGLDGKPVSIDPADPLAQAILPALHAEGVSQAGVSKIVQAFAASEVAAAREEVEAATAYRTGEQAKLGAEHAKRTAALHGQVIAAIGAEPAEALRAQMRSADAVIALEALVSKIQGPALGAPPLSPQTPASLAERLYG